MKLNGLLKIFDSSPAYEELVRHIGSRDILLTAVLADSAKPALIARLSQVRGRPLVVIAARRERVSQWVEELQSWCGPDRAAEVFPEPDGFPYERLSVDPMVTQQRLRVLYQLANGTAPRNADANATSTPTLLLTSLGALLHKTLSPREFRSATHILKVGDKVEMDALLRLCLSLGYRPQESVDLPGTLAHRGGIADIFCPNHNFPARIELYGNRIESIRRFDHGTQRSRSLVDAIAIIPAQELPLFAEKESPFLDLSPRHSPFREQWTKETAMLRQGQYFAGAEFYAPLLNASTIVDYLPHEALVILDEPEELNLVAQELSNHAQELYQQQVKRGELPQGLPEPYFPWPKITNSLPARKTLRLQRWGVEPAAERARFVDLGFRNPPGYGGMLRRFFDGTAAMLRDGKSVVITSHQSERLAELLQEEGIFAAKASSLEALPPPGSVTLVQGTLAAGWTLPQPPLTLFTDAEIFGFVKKQRASPRRLTAARETLVHLVPGDLVVHVDHGIARFTGLIRMTVAEVEREYLELEYAAADKLYVPTDQADRVSRYVGPGDYTPNLSRLGTQEWAWAKHRVRQSVGELAQELLSLYAGREVATGVAFAPDTLWQRELEAAFPYMETPDQLEAVRQVKEDMERPRPMDRLVCGDVGYGKTEVAIRAAFKAVMDGMQVALLVPTTVLAQQHLATLRERLGAFPVTVEMLSRFRSPKEQREVIDGLALGTVDICIGTHRLLQKDVIFKNLGLVVVDEEQRFGVAHKERLKRMRQEVDALTLSATPIPRTLYMSLVGVRDISTMDTPPEDRLPIKTYVGEYDDRIVREAVLRELERGGQVFFVHNRVQGIAIVAQRLRQLLPEAKIAIAHGQMPEEALERTMVEFAEGSIDVLVCTTIIESGLDIPNVNTIIINQADRLGLAQLYQLRGRVGRGTNRAYAYLLYPKDKRLTFAAQRRLQTIFEATELGAGYYIAMRDLEIRGAGNLLGSEQSGHVGAVGFDLYCRLLADAVESLKQLQEGATPEEVAQKRQPSPSIDLPLSAYLPPEYVPQLSTRLALYRRLADLRELAELEEMSQELRDRFGPLSPEARNLLYLVKVKVMALVAGVQSVTWEEGAVVIRSARELHGRRAALEQALGPAVRVGLTQVRLDAQRMRGKWQDALVEVLQSLA